MMNTRPDCMCGRVHVVDGPDAGAQLARSQASGRRRAGRATLRGHRGVHLRAGLIDVVAPRQIEPLRPRPDHAHKTTMADAAHVRTGLHSPRKEPTAMRDERERSARKRMLIDPPTPICPRRAGPHESGHAELPPSAPTRYFRADRQRLPGQAGRGQVVRDSLPHPVVAQVFRGHPRLGATRTGRSLNSSGSMKRLRDKIVHEVGLDRTCSAFRQGMVPQDFIRPISSPARLSQKDVLGPSVPGGVACM